MINSIQCIWCFSPLDEIIDELGGPANVAEMTGRKARIVRWSRDDKPRYESRERNYSNNDMDSLNIKEVRFYSRI